MTEITCTRYGSPCTMTLKACRARWELARSDKYTEIYLDPCLSCPVHAADGSGKEKTKRRTGWAQRYQPRKYNSRSMQVVQAMGYKDLGTALEDMYVRQLQTTIQIAAVLGTSKGSVSNLLRARGVPMRGKGDHR